MFDFSTPQKRERLLLIAAGLILCVIVLAIFPSLYADMNTLKNRQQKLEKDIEEYERHAKNKTEIQNRLAAFTNQSLSTKDTIQSDYQNWLMNLAKTAGIKNYRSEKPGVTRKGTHDRYTFTFNGTGKLDQIAEFLRRFHQMDYLHFIQSVAPRPNKTGEFDVVIKIETLALPQVRLAHIPKSEKEISTDDEKRMLKTIKDRAIFSEYAPPRPVIAREPERPRMDDFDATPYCFVTAIVETDGRKQCWIDYRTTGKKYQLFEGEFFYLGKVRCTVKKIEANHVQFEAAGGLYIIKLGKSFAEFE